MANRSIRTCSRRAGPITASACITSATTSPSNSSAGENALGAILGDGWYAGYLAFTGKRHYYGDKTRLLVQLQLEYEDGTQEIIGTDESWKATHRARSAKATC